MAKIQIELPQEFKFSTDIPVRVTDLNYGGHVGNDTVLSIIHEARVQFLRHFGYSEKDFGGVGLIMSNVVINFKNELFYGDVVRVAMAVADVSKASFDVVYLLKKDGDKVVGEARTGMVCFDYERKKVVSIPEIAKQKITS